MRAIKAMAVVAVLGLLLCLCACGGKQCFDCGERADRGYTIMGNFYCEDCAGF